MREVSPRSECIFEKKTPCGSQVDQVVLQIFWAVSLNLGLKCMTCLPPRASGAKCPTQQNEHLVILNISGDVLVKIVEKLGDTSHIQGLDHTHFF